MLDWIYALLRMGLMPGAVEVLGLREGECEPGDSARMVEILAVERIEGQSLRKMNWSMLMS